MLKKMITFAAIAGLVFALAPAAQAAIITDPGVPAYRLVFVTSAGNGHSSTTTLAEYNGFVADAVTAAGGDLAALGTTWKCIGSTVAVSAKSNTGTDTTGGANDVPIYNLAGDLVAAGNAELWDGGIDNAIGYDEYGVEQNFYPDTGTAEDGTQSAFPFGHATTITYGRAALSDGGWILVGPQEYSALHARFYGMSGVIPEPATMAMLLLGLPFVMRRKRR